MNCKVNQTLIYLAAAITVLMTGCGRPTKFSTVLNGGFDPVSAFRKQGYAVEAETRGESVSNPKWGYAWASWSGVLAHSKEPAAAKAVAAVIRDELNRSLGGTSLDELTVRAGFSDSPALNGMLRYNKDSVHGDVHVWLTPVASNTAVSYVIFIREHRLK